METSIVPGCWNDHQALFATVKDRSVLVESEEKFSRAFHGNPLPMVINAMDTGIFIDVNDAYLQALGFHRNEVMGRSAGWIAAGASLAKRRDHPHDAPHLIYLPEIAFDQTKCLEDIRHSQYLSL